MITKVKYVEFCYCQRYQSEWEITVRCERDIERRDRQSVTL